MSEQNLKRASHALSQLVRHGAGEVGLAMDAAGGTSGDDRLRRAGGCRGKCDEVERPVIAEYYQRCLGEELPESTMRSAVR